MTDRKHTHRKTKSRSTSTRRNHENEHGAAFVELALSFLLFLALFFLSIDVLRIGYNNALAQFIVTKAVQEGAILSGGEDTRCEAIVTSISNDIDTFGIGGNISKATDIIITRADGTQSSGGDCLSSLGTGIGGIKSSGKSEEFFAIQLRYELPFTVGVLFQFSHRIEAIAIARNEPADI